MYAFFKGKIESVLKDRVIINVNNIGYEIYMPENELQELKEKQEEVKINTYLQVREDDMKLFGFLSVETLNFFKKLISVSGVGAKIANVSASDMCVSIATDDVASLKQIPGIGPKMAQKIIFELKDKVLKEEMEQIQESKQKKAVVNPNEQEAITALQVLGYNNKDIKEVMSKLDISNDKVEDIIRKVLKEMQNI